MAHFQVIIDDEYLGMNCESFDNFEEAQEYWDEYVEAETCVAGEMIDLDNNETIWYFDVENTYDGINRRA